MAFDVSTPEGRRAAAAAGTNTLGTPSGRPDLYWPNGQPITDADFENIRKYGTALSDEDARRFEVNQGNVEANRALTAQEHADQVKQARALLKQRQYEFDYQNGPNSLNERQFTEGTRRFDVGTGLDILKTGATLRGPLNAFQGEAFARGVQTNGLSPALATLRSGGVPAFGGATATTANPPPLTVGTLANELAGTGGSGVGSAAQTAATDAYGRPTLSPAYQQNLDAIDTIAKRGLANLPQGAWENLSDAEKQSYISGSDYLGRDTASELEFRRRSRVGQGSATAA